MRHVFEDRKKATDVKEYPILVLLPVNPKTPYLNWLVPFAPTLRKEIFDHVGTDIEAYEMSQLWLIAGVKWRITTKSKRVIAAKQSSAPGIGALDMIVVVRRGIGERNKCARL